MPEKDRAMSLFFENDTDQVVRKPEVYDIEYGPPARNCGKCHVRINSLADKYGMVVCPNGHRNSEGKS